MRDAEHRVTVLDVVDQHPQPDQVVDVAEVAASDHHLLVDRVVVLWPAVNGGLDLVLGQLRLELGDQFAQVALAAGGRLRDHVDDLGVHLRLDRRERQVLELPLDGVHAQAVRERGEDVQRLGGDPDPLVGPQVAEGAHVVEAVGQLDDEDADLFAGGHDHLADGLGLRGLAVGQLVQLGDAVDHVGDLVAEVGAQLLERVVGVLDGVVQQGRDEHRLGHAELGEDGGDGERVRDVRVAGLAGLALVVVLGGAVGPLDDGQVGLRVVGPDDPEQRVEDG